MLYRYRAGIAWRDWTRNGWAIGKQATLDLVDDRPV